MRKDFYLFRHGETDYNLQKRWQGQGIDLPLNTTGIKQAEALAERLKPLKLEVIYASPLKRAQQTSQIVADKLDIPLQTLDELIESNLGVCEGMYADDIKVKYPDIWQDWYSETVATDTRWPEGESKLEIQQRMFGAFAKMLKAKEKIIGAASHGGAMRYFLMAFGYGPHKMPNTALFHIVYENGKWRLEE